MADRLPLLLLLLLPVGLAATAGAARQLTSAGDVTGEQLGCLVSYLKSKGRRTVDIYIDYPVTGNSPSSLIFDICSEMIFA